MAGLLRARGYATLAAGKWHNTYDRNLHSSADTRPTRSASKLARSRPTPRYN